MAPKFLCCLPLRLGVLLFSVLQVFLSGYLLTSPGLWAGLVKTIAFILEDYRQLVSEEAMYLAFFGMVIASCVAGIYGLVGAVFRKGTWAQISASINFATAWTYVATVSVKTGLFHMRTLATNIPEECQGHECPQNDNLPGQIGKALTRIATLVLPALYIVYVNTSYAKHIQKLEEDLKKVSEAAEKSSPLDIPQAAATPKRGANQPAERYLPAWLNSPSRLKIALTVLLLGKFFDAQRVAVITFPTLLTSGPGNHYEPRINLWGAFIASLNLFFGGLAIFGLITSSKKPLTAYRYFGWLKLVYNTVNIATAVFTLALFGDKGIIPTAPPCHPNDLECQNPHHTLDLLHAIRFWITTRVILYLVKVCLSKLETPPEEDKEGKYLPSWLRSNSSLRIAITLIAAFEYIRYKDVAQTYFDLAISYNPALFVGRPYGTATLIVGTLSYCAIFITSALMLHGAWDASKASLTPFYQVGRVRLLIYLLMLRPTIQLYLNGDGDYTAPTADQCPKGLGAAYETYELNTLCALPPKLEFNVFVAFWNVAWMVAALYIVQIYVKRIKQWEEEERIKAEASAAASASPPSQAPAKPAT